MARTQIKFAGENTANTYPDGASLTLVNLRPSPDGTLTPTPPALATEELSDTYQMFFNHKHGDSETLLGIKHSDSGTSKIYYARTTQGENLIGETASTIHRIEQIGKILSLICEDTIEYLLLSDGKYTLFSSLPELPLQYITVPESNVRTEYYDSATTYTTNAESPISTDEAHNKECRTRYVAVMNALVEAIKTGGVISTAVKQNGDYQKTLEASPNLLFDAHLCRIALRLYDGSLVKHSPVFLIMPPTSLANMRKLFLTLRPYESDGRKFRYWDGAIVSAFTAQIKLAMDELYPYRDLITHVEIYMSPPLGWVEEPRIIDWDYDTLNEFYESVTETSYDSTASVKSFPTVKPNLTEAYYKALCNMSSFYLVKSIDTATHTKPLIVNFPETDFNMDALTSQEEMTTEAISHHTITSETSITYNSVLTLGGITQTLYGGYAPNLFSWTGNFAGYQKTDKSADTYAIRTTIKTDSGTKRVFSKPATLTDGFFLNPYISYPDSRATKMELFVETSNGLYERVEGEINLTEHPTLNLAYYIHHTITAETDNDGTAQNRYSIQPIGESPFSLNGIDLDEGEVEIASVHPAIEYFPNKIRYAKTDNPLVFPETNTLTVGNTEVLNLSATVMNVSDRNYGQALVYAFCSDGVWTLHPSTTTTYTSAPTITWSETPNSSIVCPTPFGVLFLAEKGLYVINNTQTTLLSEALHTDTHSLNIPFPPTHTATLISDGTDISFTSYLKGVTQMLWEPYHSEAFITNPNHAYSYVFNATSKAFYKTTQTLGVPIQNHYGSLRHVVGQIVLDHSITHTELDEAHITYISRPITLATSDIKNFERVILRALLYAPTDAFITLHASNDGVNFVPLRGINLPTHNLRDLDMGLLASAKFRYIIVSFAGHVRHKSVISHLDVTLRQQFSNTKMR